MQSTKSVTSLISGQISTEEEALLAVEQHPDTLAYIPDHLQTDRVLFTALVQKMELFKVIEIERLNPQLIKKLLTAKPHTREFIADELLTDDIYLEQVKQDGMWLQHVPVERRTIDICLEAINQNVNSHQFVPDEVQNKNYLDHLILIDPKMLNEVQVANRSPSVVLRLLDNDHSAIKHLPSDFRNKEMCIKAIKGDIEAVRWFPDEIYEDEEVFNLIANHEYFENFDQVPPSQKVNDKYHPHYVRPKLADYLVAKDVVKHFPLLPMDVLTPEHCKKAIQECPRLVKICPKKIRIENNLWEIALTLDGTVLRSIPKDERTAAIEVLEKNHKALNKSDSLFDFLTKH